MICKLTLLLYFPICFSYLSCFYSIEVTPPRTSPVKVSGGKKRAIGDCESDDEDIFVPRYDILSVCNIVCSDKFFLLVLQGTAQKRHAPKSLLLLQRLPSLLGVSLSLIQRCMYLF